MVSKVFSLLVAVCLPFLVSCGSDPKSEVPPTQGAVTMPKGCPSSPETAVYSLSLQGKWSSASHPTDFPTNGHFTPLIGLTHDENFSLWELAGLASPGVQSVAETGQVSTIITEIQSAIDSGHGDALIQGTSIASTGVLNLTVTVRASHPYVSV